MKESIKEGIKAKVVILLVLLFTGCAVKKEETLISGITMGTTYYVKVVTRYSKDLAGLAERIDKRLQEIEGSMSTFRKDSEISRFNALTCTEEKFYISDDFWHVVTVAKDLYRLTGGALDATIKPLVDLWGFRDLEKRGGKIPQEEKIEGLLADTGFNYIEISKNRYLVKRRASISLDLASVVQGYAVDQVAELIRKEGVADFLIELGGEVYASGFREDGKEWRVGIRTPENGTHHYGQIYSVVTLHNRALATSGDYIKFFEIDGKRFSHILDPRTGHPVANSVVSVSITADTSIFADGLATAIMVLGPKEGLELINSLDSVDCLIIVRNEDGSLIDYYSEGFNGGM